MSLLIGAAPVALGLAFCRYKARRYDGVTELFEVQKAERELAPKIFECLARNFALLAESTGYITVAAAHRVDKLEVSDSDKELIKLALRRIGGEWVVDKNPWMLAFHRYYQCTRVGHIIGMHKEERSTDASVGFSAGAIHEVAIEDWGISHADLVTYVKRVNDRIVVNKNLRINRCFSY